MRYRSLLGQHLLENLGRGHASVKNRSLGRAHVGGDLTDRLPSQDQLDDPAATIGKRFEQPLDEIAERSDVGRRRARFQRIAIALKRLNAGRIAAGPLPELTTIANPVKRDWGQQRPQASVLRDLDPVLGELAKETPPKRLWP